MHVEELGRLYVDLLLEFSLGRQTRRKVSYSKGSNVVLSECISKSFSDLCRFRELDRRGRVLGIPALLVST